MLHIFRGRLINYPVQLERENQSSIIPLILPFRHSMSKKQICDAFGMIFPLHFIHKNSKFHRGRSFAGYKKYCTGTNRQQQHEYGSEQNKYAFVYTQPDGAPNWDLSSRAPSPMGPPSITYDKDSCHLCVWEDAIHQTLPLLPTDFSAGAQLWVGEEQLKGG